MRVWAARDNLLSNPGACPILYIGCEPLCTKSRDGTEYIPQPFGGRTFMAALCGLEIAGLAPGECREVEIRVKT